MNWISLTNSEQLDSLIKESESNPQVIFKHSTSCSISSMAKSRLERSSPAPGFTFHYLDLIRYRSLSTRIADQFHIRHQSPQVLVIKNQKCIYNESHSGISMDEIAELVQA